MIFGECPYCYEHIALSLPEDIPLPVMAKIDCEYCGKTFVEKFSRINPEAYRLEGVVIDEENKTIKLAQSDNVIGDKQ